MESTVNGKILSVLSYLRIKPLKRLQNTLYGEIQQNFFINKLPKTCILIDFEPVTYKNDKIRANNPKKGKENIKRNVYFECY